MPRSIPLRPDPGVSPDIWAVSQPPEARVLLAGLLAHDPSLAGQSLPAAEWQARLTEYQHTPCP